MRIRDIGIERSAWVLIKRYGLDANKEAVARAQQLLVTGNIAGARAWFRIINAIERLVPESGTIVWLEAEALAEARRCIRLGAIWAA